MAKKKNTITNLPGGALQTTFPVEGNAELPVVNYMY